jgi:hypothetical protein
MTAYGSKPKPRRGEKCLSLFFCLGNSVPSTTTTTTISTKLQRRITFFETTSHKFQNNSLHLQEFPWKDMENEVIDVRKTEEREGGGRRRSPCSDLTSGGGRSLEESLESWGGTLGVATPPSRSPATGRRGREQGGRRKERTRAKGPEKTGLGGTTTGSGPVRCGS